MKPNTINCSEFLSSKLKQQIIKTRNNIIKITGYWRK